MRSWERVHGESTILFSKVTADDDRLAALQQPAIRTARNLSKFTEISMYSNGVSLLLDGRRLPRPPYLPSTPRSSLVVYSSISVLLGATQAPMRRVNINSSNSSNSVEDRYLIRTANA